MKNTPKVYDSSIEFVSKYIIPATDNKIMEQDIAIAQRYVTRFKGCKRETEKKQSRKIQ